ncbi:hypothetical protein [Micromonospora craniellae]|uniref:hypothetical protein n=1 Tax=Micromonospora craniellae TaxID=2294034 RepID=UPI0011C15440|nr:hypothetical protein [Micromonospora craniellae]QOC91894.1 hypothetical protein ID554_29035 [Micromonospora craniellae]
MQVEHLGGRGVGVGDGVRHAGPDAERAERLAARRQQREEMFTEAAWEERYRSRTSTGGSPGR